MLRFKFCLAEAYWKLGMNSEAYEAFKAGVNADMDFTAKYIYPGTKGQAVGGDKITKAVFTTSCKLNILQDHMSMPLVSCRFLIVPHHDAEMDCSLSVGSL